MGPNSIRLTIEHQADAFPRIAAVEIALDPVVGRAAPELLERLRVLRFGPIELGASPEHRVDPARLRAVRVVGSLDFRVVLAVDRDPLLRHHAGREPEPEPEEMADRRMQIERACACERCRKIVTHAIVTCVTATAKTM
jgi:hypothetical protein